MSWNGYIDNLMACGHLQHVAILGVDGNVWAASKDFKLDRSEADTIVNGFKNAQSISGSGISISGTKYFFLQGDEKQIQCKKGQHGITMSKANTCILVGVYTESHTPGMARNAVEKMGEYLRDASY